MSHHHAVVWLDHSEAHFMHISPDDILKSVVHPAHPHAHLHAKRGNVGSGRQAEDKGYYHAIVEALSGAQEILVVGPAQAKLQLVKHMHAHDQGVAEKVGGRVETVDHPSDAQLVAYARRYVRAEVLRREGPHAGLSRRPAQGPLPAPAFNRAGSVDDRRCGINLGGRLLRGRIRTRRHDGPGKFLHHCLQVAHRVQVQVDQVELVGLRQLRQHVA